MDRETISALIYQQPCRSVLDQDAATGELLLAAPVCSTFAAMQTHSSLRKKQKKKLILKQRCSYQSTELFSQCLILFSQLFSPTMSGLRRLRSITMEIMSDIIVPSSGH